MAILRIQEGELDWESLQPKDDIAQREKDIRLIINDFKMLEVGEFETHNISAWRTSFYNYLRNFNETQLSDRKFSIYKYGEKWRIKRTA